MKTAISTTKNYALFTVIKDNRSQKLPKHKKLRASMVKYGWIAGYPAVCIRRNGKLCIFDGQHRFRIAQELGIPVQYVVVDTAADVAEINDAQRPWDLSDYAYRWANDGRQAYSEVQDFAKSHRVPLSLAAGLLWGHTEGSNIGEIFKAGEFTIRERKYSNMTVQIYDAVRTFAPAAATVFCIRAIGACCRVADFDVSRMISNIERRSDLLQKMGDRDAYLTVLERIYNDHYGNKRVPLKFLAIEAMNGRNAAKKSAKK